MIASLFLFKVQVNPGSISRLVLIQLMLAKIQVIPSPVNTGPDPGKSWSRSRLDTGLDPGYSRSRLIGI